MRHIQLKNNQIILWFIKTGTANAEMYSIIELCNYYYAKFWNDAVLMTRIFRAREISVRKSAW